MCQSEPSLRILLSDAVEVCTVHSSQCLKEAFFAKYVSKLHKEVLGGLFESDTLSQTDQDIFMDETTDNSLGLKWTGDITDCHSSCSYTENSGGCEAEAKMNYRNPKERWKAAVAKITQYRIGKQNHHATNYQRCRDHESFQSLVKLCDELKERKKILDLMKIHISNSSLLFTDSGKASFLAKVLLPKTSNDVVLFPQQHITNQVPDDFPLMDTDEVTETIQTSLEFFDETSGSSFPTEVSSAVHCMGTVSNYYSDVPQKTYYSIKDIALGKSYPWKTSGCQEKLVSGPEFILGSLKPHAEVTIPGDKPFEEEDKESSLCCVCVVIPNGERITITCSLTVTAAQIFLAVIQYMALQDHYLFGLAYIQDHEFLFVEGKQKLSKIIHSSTLSDPYESEDQRTFTLYLRVKFYVEDVSALRNLASRHLFYLQLRKNLLDEFTHCNSEAAIILGGLALQSEFGDYSSKEHGNDYFLVEHYMPFRSIKQLSRQIAKEKLYEQHMSLAGMSTDTAELRFIQEVQSIAEYGCNFHKVLQDKRNPSSVVWLAVSSKGVDVYENVCDERRKSQEYPWSRIKRISFTKKYFCLLPKTEMSSGKHVVYKFYTPFPFKSQYLFHLTVAHHRFFVKLKSKIKISETFFEDVDADQSLSGEMSEWPLEIEVEHEIGFDIHPNEDSLSPSLSKKARYIGKVKSLQGSIITHTLPLRTVFVAEKLPSPLIFMKPLSLSKYRASIVHRKLYSSSCVRRSSSAPAEYSKFMSEEERLFSSYSFKNGIHEKVSGTMPRTSCRKRQIKMVRLIKDKKFGLGLTITCGDTYDTVLHGAFVELITPAGPADRDGNLSPGDQILAVNGIDVQNDHFLDVADLLQQCNSPVELVIGKPCTKINVVKPDIFDKIEDKLDEPRCVKVRTWLSNNSTEASTALNPPLSHALEDSLSQKSPPVPKPRKKWSEKENSSTVNSSVSSTAPDLTVETCSSYTEQKKNVEENFSEMNCSIISEHIIRGKGTIPDIIASQVKNVSASDSDLQPVSDSWDYLTKANEERELSDANVSPSTSMQLNEDCIANEKMIGGLTAGDIYHIVLDKKGGSLGLNIFQGKDPSCPSQRNIYVHSLIPGGAAEIDNRIKPGDKLLEVNGVLLENLSYNDVVNTLRESAQVTHLVLERGIPAFPNTVDESLHGQHHSSDLKMFQLKREVASESAINKKDSEISQRNNHKVGFVITSDESCLSANENNDCIAEKETSDYIINKNAVSQVKPEPKHNLHFPAFDKHVNNMETSSLPNVLAKNLRNSVSLNSLPSASNDILHIESGFSESITEYSKDISGSVPYLNKSTNDCYQTVSQCQNSVLHATHDSLSDYLTCYSADISSRCGDATDWCTSPNLTKDFTHNNNGLSTSVESISKSVVMYRSTPNLTENVHNEEDKHLQPQLHRNKSTDCLLASDGINEDLSSELHQPCFIRSAGNDINQVPKAPLRKKKLKRLEDILNYSNSENTFTVTIRKSSRGLGLSISGGRNAHSTDPVSQLISIRKLYPLQPALECGKLSIGDIILEVNGTNMIGLSNTEALEILRSASTNVSLKIFRPSKSLIFPLAMQECKWKLPGDSQSSSASSSLSRNETKLHDIDCEDIGEFEVILIKREGSLGFTVSRKESQDGVPLSGIYVKSLIKEPALSDGRIHPGDRIVQVNGTDISSMSHAEAITFLRNAPESVTLKLFRSDPPLSPYFTDEDYPTSKPLRWEAVELLNDRVKNKDNETSAERKAKRKLKKCTNDGPSTSSSESESSSSSSGQEHIISSCPMDLQDTETLGDEGPGLQRNQRPKSLDVLNTSDRKQRMSDVADDGNFHRQASVIENPANLKMSATEDTCDVTPTKKGGKALLKWRGSTLPSEDSIDTENFSSSFSKSEDFNSLSDTHASTEQNISDLVPENENSLKETGTVVQPKEPWVRTFDVELDRKWYGRLGFSLCDSPSDDDSPRSLLPRASEVKAVHPGSLAAKDGRIAVGDRLVEVNSESVLGKSAAEVIDMMRRLTGLTKMVFCRLEGVS